MAFREDTGSIRSAPDNPADWLRPQDNAVTYTHRAKQWVHSAVSGKEGEEHKVFVLRLISEVLFASLVQAEEEWSLCGMSTVEKQKPSSAVERACLRAAWHTNTHPRKHGWNINFLFSPPLLLCCSFTHTNTHVHLSVQSYPPARQPRSRVIQQCKQYNLRVHVRIHLYATKHSSKPRKQKGQGLKNLCSQHMSGEALTGVLFTSHPSHCHPAPFHLLPHRKALLSAALWDNLTHIHTRTTHTHLHFLASPMLAILHQQRKYSLPLWLFSYVAVQGGFN